MDGGLQVSPIVFLKYPGTAWDSSQGASTSPLRVWEERNILEILMVYIILKNFYCLNIPAFYFRR